MVIVTDPYLELALDCINAFYARMFRDWPTAVSYTAEHYIMSYSGSTRLTGANHLWLNSPDGLTREILEEASQFFNQYHAAWSVVITDSYMPSGLNLLREEGYFTRWTSPLMVLDQPPKPLPSRDDVKVIRASTPEHLRDMALIMSEAFATGDDVNRRVTRQTHLRAKDVVHYLIYAGPHPAACATAVLSGKMGGIWNVGTRYRFRRQRYATTVMNAMLADLKARGASATMLMASEAGYPLYEQLGYRQIGITHYMGPPYTSRFN